MDIYTMISDKTFMAADYICNGEMRRKVFEIGTADPQVAIQGLLTLGQEMGWDIRCIYEVIGVKSLDEMEEAAKSTFVRPGLVTIMHVFDEEEVYGTV